MKQNQSISQSINLKMLLAIVISTAIFMLISYIITAKSEYNNLLEDSETSSSRLVQMLQIPLWNFDTDLINQFVKIFMDKNNVCRIEVLNDSGEFVTFIENHKYADKKDTPHLIVNKPIIFNKIQLGSLKIHFTKQSIYINIQRLIIVNVILVIVLTIVLIFLFKQNINRQVIKPLNVILESIKDISKGNYDKFIKDDFQFEFQTLTASFNQMISAINSSTQEIKDINFKINSLLDTIPDAVILHAEDGSILEVNETATTMFGYSETEFTQMNIDQFNGKNHTAAMLSAAHQIAIKSGFNEFEWLSRNKSGTEFPVIIRIKQMVMNNQYFLLSVYTDTSEKKAAESKLIEEKEKLNVTLRSINDGVIVTDTDGHIILMNMAAEKMTGYPEDKVMGLNVDSILQMVDGKSRNRIYPPVRTAISTQVVQNFSKHTLLIGKNETEYTIDGSASPVTDNNKSIGVVFVFKDITEKEKMEQEIIKNQKLESIGLLAGGIAHDFNNLLAAISSYVSLVRLHSDKNNNSYQYLRDIEGIIENAKGLTGQLLTFSKGGAPVKQSLKVDDVIEDSTKFVLSGTAIKLDIHKDKKLWTTDIDENQISQAIHNIILNAKQAMNNKGQIAITVNNQTLDEVNSYSMPAGKYVHITIKDFGCGIPENVINKIFDPFFTTKESGNGLGLAMVHSIILKHGGYINVKSPKKDGTIFTILLPAHTNTVKPKTEALEVITSTGSLNILLLDDERIIRDSASELLEYLGHKVISVADGVDAVDTYKDSIHTDNQFDLVILDLTIPGGMGGEETMKHLLSIDPKVTAIVSSGYSEDEIMAQYHNYGFKGVIAKPYNIEKLAQVISSVFAE